MGEGAVLAIDIILKTTVFICLAIEAIKDLRTRTIDSRVFIYSCVPLVCIRIIISEEALCDMSKDVLAGLAVGILFIVLSLISREAIGLGDSLIICWLGVVLGVAAVVEILSFCLIFNFIAALILFFKRKKKARIPMVPFMLGGYILYMKGIYL